MEQSFFAVHVDITWADGSSTHRDYVRGNRRISKADYTSFALGDLIGTVTGWTYRSQEISEITVFEIQENEVH